MSDVMSVGHESKDLTAYCDICKCELSIARTWYHASGNLDVCKAHFDEIATAKRDWNKYNIVRHIDDLGNEVDAYVRKPVAHIFQTSSAEAKLAALIMNRMSCPTVTVDLVIRCLITAPPQDFFEAALQGEVETSRRMLAWDGALLYAVDLDGELDLKGATGLTHAVASGSAKLVDFLVSARADVMATSELGNTALLVAADTGQVDLVRILLAGSPCGTLAARHRNKFGQTALHWGAVALHNALDVSELLLEEPVPRRPDRRGVGRAPLERASRRVRPSGRARLRARERPAEVCLRGPREEPHLVAHRVARRGSGPASASGGPRRAP
ncbi:unnamed protein product [Prorocentrum cordatum]|uniref:Uncharacterized protein n=1 Tax=Prorocentrum cordatum TaxID=2364126 RepID=A0ABN9UU00_9DINO|nr:unnamed protein product [Polarella glacialis]